MFNPEKMLGSLLTGGVSRKRGLGGLLSGGAALGLAGVAMEAVEHFMNSAKQSQGLPPVAPPGAATGSGPPPLPGGGPGAAPPPPPSQAPGPPPVAPPAPPPSAEEAVLLIRAMIAAAKADGVIDAEERQRILAKLDAVQLSPEERSFMEAELARPHSAEAIAAAVQGPEQARQVYLVSLLAVEVDTPEERNYLETLAGLLGLDAAAVTTLHKATAIDPSA